MGEPMGELMRDASVVARQYAATDALMTRASVWGPGPEGRNPVEVLRQSVVALAPTYVVEIGCGTGGFAERVCRDLPTCDYLATDLSPAMVDAARARGVTAACAGADALPVPDGVADVVVAAWMLYHVPDLDAALREVGRVLAPGGTFFAVTNGDAHLETLLADAGVGPTLTQFSSENGAATLRRHFVHVSADDIPTEATFPDHAAAAAYLQSIDPALGAALGPFEGSRRDRGFTTIFTARQPIAH